MKEAHKGVLGLMLVFALMGGLACDGGGGSGGGGGGANPVPTIFGSGNIVQETRSVTGATGVDLRGVANLTIEQGGPEELILETDDNLMAYILTEVQGEILVISKDPNVNLEPSQSQGTGIEAHLTLSSIDSITLSGVGDITVPDLMTTQLELTQSGVGGIEISDLDTLTTDVLISGVGNVSITGQVEDQIVTLSSVGDYIAENFSSETADIEVAGIGSATVRVSTTLSAHITSSGSVYYYGSPAVTRTGTGTGSVKQRSP
jgi:hypothetical protein